MQHWGHPKGDRWSAATPPPPLQIGILRIADFVDVIVPNVLRDFTLQPKPATETCC
jgi:hypothetical protein